MLHDVHVLAVLEMAKEGNTSWGNLVCIQLMTCLPLELDS